ncbi:SH3 domain-containing protein, partial [bacterium]|nr:SH3 domain-containing protein [bacterium]
MISLILGFSFSCHAVEDQFSGLEKSGGATSQGGNSSERPDSTGNLLNEQTEEKVEGFVYSKLAKIKGDQLIITGSSVNLRTGPSTKYKKLDTVKAGASYSYIGKSRSWYKFYYKGSASTVALEQEELIQVDLEFDEYKVVSGDSLAGIATKKYKAVYSRGYILWPMIYALSHLKSTGLKIGQVLKLPKYYKDSSKEKSQILNVMQE